MKKYVYDFDVIDAAGKGTETDPYIPEIVTLFPITKWYVLPDGSGIVLEVSQDVFNTFPLKYKQKASDSLIGSTETRKKFEDKRKEKV